MASTNWRTRPVVTSYLSMRIGIGSVAAGRRRERQQL